MFLLWYLVNLVSFLGFFLFGVEGLGLNLGRLRSFVLLFIVLEFFLIFVNVCLYLRKFFISIILYI